MSAILPPKIVQRLGESPLFDPKVLNAGSPPDTSIRIHPDKWMAPTDAWEQVPWCKDGFYMPNRPTFHLDPLFHAGAYFVEDAATMFLAHVLLHLGLDKRAVKALDICAARGANTTLMNSTLHPQSLIVANEIIESNVPGLLTNLIRWGLPNTIVATNESSSFNRVGAFFDLVVVDVPGSGLLPKNRQQTLLADSLSCLVDEGYLVFSTSSDTDEENKELIDWLLSHYPLKCVEIPLDASWDVETLQSPLRGGTGSRIYRHRRKEEGLFMSVFQKSDPGARSTTFDQKVYIDDHIDPSIPSWVKEPSSFFTFTHGEKTYLFPKEYALDLLFLKQHLSVRRAGVALGNGANKELIPDHELAVSVLLHPSIKRVDVDLPAAQNYLRKNSMEMDWFKDLEPGWYVISYLNIPFGWVKTLKGGRIQNCFPEDWRIF